MKKNNIIRFLHSLALLPILTGTMPVTAGFKAAISPENNQIVLSQKQNIEAFDPISLNQKEDPEAKTRELRSQAIDTYFESYDMPLAGLGAKMVEESEKYNLDWRLLPAIAVRESTGGKFACKRVPYNPFGWGSCKISFDSYEEAIEVVAKNLGGENPNTAKYYSGKDTKGILLAYNPPSIVPKYSSQVIYIMNSIGEKELISTHLALEV